CERKECGRRGNNAIAHEQICIAFLIPMELDMPGESIARIDLLKSDLKHILSGMCHVGLKERTFRLSTSSFRDVLVTVRPSNEKRARTQGYEGFDGFLCSFHVVLGMRRREAQCTLGPRIEDIGTPSPASWIGGIRDTHSGWMTRGRWNIAGQALHENVVCPAGRKVKEL